MFVQSERFVEEHGGRLGDIAIFGQEVNHTTWRLCMMNLAVRGIEGDIRWNNQGTFLNNALPDLRSDFVLANPPFNVSDWSGDNLRDDGRWKYGAPPTGNANYGWLQHILNHLAPNGTAGVILANGSMSSNTGGEGDIRKAMVEGEVAWREGDGYVDVPGFCRAASLDEVREHQCTRSRPGGMSKLRNLRTMGSHSRRRWSG